MTRKEEIESKANELYYSCAPHEATIKMAEWADETLIKKVYEWLDEHLIFDDEGHCHDDICENGLIEDFIKDFKSIREE